MANPWFQFKQFLIRQDRSAMKVTTDACLFGAWTAAAVGSQGRNVERVLDIGTGTGLLSLMLAQTTPDIIIDALEIDAAAAQQAKDNVDESPWKDRVTIVQADAKTWVAPARYDCIISNPPFYEKELRSENHQKNLAYHSDELPLGALLEMMKKNIAPGGQFFLLLPFKRDAEIKVLLLENDCHIHEMVFVRQSTGHDYFRIMLMGSFDKDAEQETIITEIAVKNKEQQYTTAFIDLLKEYYLYL